MRIKKFQAHSLKEATEQMKRDLGPEAIIISSRKVTRGGPFNLLGRDMFEVTGAIDEVAPAPQSTYRRRPESPEFAQHLERSSVDLEEQRYAGQPAPDCRAIRPGRA